MRQIHYQRQAPRNNGGTAGRDLPAAQPLPDRARESAAQTVGQTATPEEACKIEAPLAHSFKVHYTASGCEQLRHISEAQHKAGLYPVLMSVVTPKKWTKERTPGARAVEEVIAFFRREQ